MKQTLLLLIAFLSITLAKASDFIQDGIAYNIISSTTVEVTSKQGWYSGDVVIPMTVTNGGNVYTVITIGYYSFSGSSDLISVYIPESVTTIHLGAFTDCTSLTSINIPSSVTTILPAAFDGCNSLVSVTIPMGVTALGYDAFRNCTSLETVILPNSLESIGTSAFENCTSLTAINLPSSLITISNIAFAYCENLVSIDIPQGVTTIGKAAFDGCTTLTSVTIPESVISIEQRAFKDCIGLTSVIVNIITPIVIPTSTFQDVNISQIPLFVPAGTEADYEAAAVWQDFQITTLGIATNDLELNLTVYPNPVQDVLYIKEKTATAIQQVNIFDVQGKEIMITTGNSINISGLQKGLYILQIETDKGIVTKKFIKE